MGVVEVSDMLDIVKSQKLQVEIEAREWMKDEKWNKQNTHQWRPKELGLKLTMKAEKLELKSAMKVDEECPKWLWYNVGESGKKFLFNQLLQS